MPPPVLMPPSAGDPPHKLTAVAGPGKIPMLKVYVFYAVHCQNVDEYRRLINRYHGLGQTHPPLISVPLF